MTRFRIVVDDRGWGRSERKRAEYIPVDRLETRGFFIVPHTKETPASENQQDRVDVLSYDLGYDGQVLRLICTNNGWNFDRLTREHAAALIRLLESRINERGRVA